jgi:hypothetical protein
MMTHVGIEPTTLRFGISRAAIAPTSHRLHDRASVLFTYHVVLCSAHKPAGDTVQRTHMRHGDELSDSILQHNSVLGNRRSAVDRIRTCARRP